MSKFDKSVFLIFKPISHFHGVGIGPLSKILAVNTYFDIDTNDLAAMEPARKAITHHAWHVMTFFFIHWHQSYISQVLYTIAPYIL